MKYFPDNAVKGINLMIFAGFLNIVMNMFSKILSDVHSPIEIVFWRNVVALFIVLLLLGHKRDFALLKTTRIKEHIVRGIAGTLGLILIFWAYALMPMAEVVTLLFTAGLITTMASSIFLKEHVGLLRWGAVFIGFVGAALTAMPIEGLWNLEGSVVALFAAFVSGGIVNMMLRTLGRTEPALTSVFYVLVIGITLTLPYVLYAGHLPTSQSIWFILGCGTIGGVSLITKTLAFQYAEASLLSPTQYIAIIWAAILGWLVWDHIPASNVILGAGIIIACNIFILWREKNLKKMKTK